MMKVKYHGDYADTMGIKQGQKIEVSGPNDYDGVEYYVYKGLDGDEFVVFIHEMSWS